MDNKQSRADTVSAIFLTLFILALLYATMSIIYEAGLAHGRAEKTEQHDD
jgi:Mn2+/Fe2+ NRAMP family transporter